MNKETKQKVLICNNCKEYWIAPKDRCKCGCTTLSETHPSNIAFANPVDPEEVKSLPSAEEYCKSIPMLGKKWMVFENPKDELNFMTRHLNSFASLCVEQERNKWETIIKLRIERINKSDPENPNWHTSLEDVIIIDTLNSVLKDLTL